jgi:hypothetical protein
MVGKIRSEMILHRTILGFASAPKVLTSSGAKVQTAGAERRQERRTGRQPRPQGRRTNREERLTKQHPARHKVASASQSGGSHGAYTWGVLDRLLDDTTIDTIGVTGTSAGGRKRHGPCQRLGVRRPQAGAR